MFFFGTAALSIRIMDVLAWIGVAIASLSLIDELGVISAFIDWLSATDLLHQFLALLGDSIGPILRQIIDGYRETVRPVFDKLGEVTGYEASNILVDFCAAIVALVGQTFVSTFERHLKARSKTIDARKGFGRITSKWLDLDPRKQERLALRLQLKKSLLFFIRRLLIYGTVLFLALLIERNWSFFQLN